MNELSIAEIGDKLGISGLLTQQSINMIVDYGFNLIAGIVTRVTMPAIRLNP